MLDLGLSFRPSVPGSRSFCFVCSKVTLLCGMVSFTTGVTRWVDRSQFSVFLNIWIVCVGFVGKVIVGVGIWLNTVIVVLVFAGTIFVVLGSVFLSFELTALVSRATWLFAVVASWFCFFWVLSCGLLRHSVYLEFIWRFQTIDFQILSKMWHTLFICASLQLRLICWFLHAGRHFGIYEIFNDRLSGISECIFCQFREFV